MTQIRPTHDHRHIADLLPGYINGTLDQDAFAQVSAHLDRCSECRAELAEWASIAAATRMLGGTLSVPREQEFDDSWLAPDSIATVSRSRSLWPRPSNNDVLSRKRTDATQQEKDNMHTALPRPQVRPGPFSQMTRPMWTATIVILLVTLGFTTYMRLPGGSDNPTRLPAVQYAASPEAAMCEASSGSLDRLTLTGPPPTDSAIALPAEPYEGRPGVTQDALPSDGEPADEETIAAVTETVQQLADCMNAENAAGTSAMVTDDYWRRTNNAGITVDPDWPRSFVPLVGPVDGHTPAPIIEEARVLPDGRVGAVIRPGFDALPWTYDYYVFANVDGRWLIDEAVHVTEVAKIEVIVEDSGFSPSEVRVPSQQAELVVRNEGTVSHSLYVPELGIRIELAPGESGTASLKAPAGTYAFISDIPGDEEARFTGTLIIEGEVEKVSSSPVASPHVSSVVMGVPVASVSIVTDAPEAFLPEQVSILADQDVEVTLTNGDKKGLPANFTIDELGISVDLDPGERETVIVNAPAGVYAFYSTIPGHSEVGMVGTLYVENDSVP